MEGLLIQSNGNSSSNALAVHSALNKAEPGATVDSLIVESLNENKAGKDKGFQRILESLSFTAQKVIEKLDVYLADYVPGGVASLKPEDHTAEKTAERIVSQVSGLYGAYARQNADKTPEELVSGFMALARKGVEQGYGEAFEILEGIGAFEIEGVQSGVETTKKLIDEKLTAFESFLRKELGIADEPLKDDDFKAPVKNDILAQGGATTIDVTA